MLLIPFIVIFGLVIFALEKNNRQAVKNAQEEFRNYTGRAEGRILEYHWNRTNPGKYIKDPETGRVESVDHFIVSYEFEADGKIYTGEGIGSTSVSRRKYQPICYDPSDPALNCTLYYLNGQVAKRHGWRSAVCCVIQVILVIVLLGITVMELFHII